MCNLYFVLQKNTYIHAIIHIYIYVVILLFFVGNVHFVNSIINWLYVVIKK